METDFEEQSMNLDKFILDFDNVVTHPVMAPLIDAMNKIHSENPHFTSQQVMEALGQQQSQGMAGHMQENHFKNEGLYVSDVQPEAVHAYEPQFQVHNRTSGKIEDHLPHLDLNSHGNNQNYTINMDDLIEDPLDVQPRQRRVKNKTKAAGRSVAHKRQCSSTALGHSASLEASISTTPMSGGWVPDSQGLTYPGDEVSSLPVLQMNAMSIHPEVSSEMEDIFHPQHTNYLENDSLRLTGSPHPVAPLIPDDSFNTYTGHISPLAAVKMKDELLASTSTDFSLQGEGQYGTGAYLQFDDQFSCNSPAQSCISNSNLPSHLSRVHYLDVPPTPSPSTQNSLNCDYSRSPSSSCSNSYTNPSPSSTPSVRGHLDRPSRSFSANSSRQLRMSLANFSKEEKHMRVRSQNNQASRDYRRRTKEKVAGLEAEVYLREQKKEEQMRVYADSEKKVKLLRQLLAECQKRGIFPNMVFSDHQ